MPHRCLFVQRRQHDRQLEPRLAWAVLRRSHEAGRQLSAPTGVRHSAPTPCRIRQVLTADPPGGQLRPGSHALAQRVRRSGVRPELPAERCRIRAAHALARLQCGHDASFDSRGLVVRVSLRHERDAPGHRRSRRNWSRNPGLIERGHAHRIALRSTEPARHDPISRRRGDGCAARAPEDARRRMGGNGSGCSECDKRCDGDGG